MRSLVATLKWLRDSSDAARRWRWLRCWAIGAALAGVGCRDAVTRAVDPEPTFSIEKAPLENGDLQVDTVFATVEPLRVLVRADAEVARGVRVFWTISANGQTETWSTVTDDAGIASVQPTLGSKPGVHTVQASLRRSASGPSIAFSLTATPGQPVDIRLTSGDDQVDSATALLPTAYAVRVSDAHGNVIANVPVDWTVTSGGGTISPPQSLTGPDGEAVARYTLGTKIGGNEVIASIPGIERSVTFRSTATAAEPVSLILVSGDSQAASVGQSLADDFVVRVADRHDNGVGGITIDWTITAGDGSLSATRSATGADGTTAIRLSLGTHAGPRTVTATALQLPSAPKVAFTANAIAPPPPPPPSQTQAAMLVTVTTTGEDADDGFVVFAQRCSSYPANCQTNGIKKIVNAGVPTPVTLAPGDYAVTILDVGSHCAVADNFRKVTVLDRSLVDAPFTVECRPMSRIHVRPSTTGVDAPNLFYVSLDGGTYPVVPDEVNAFKVPDGTHIVSFAVTAANCTLRGANTVSVTVLDSGIANVEFIVECVTNPTLRVTVIATGTNVPSSFGVNIWSEYADGEHGLTVPANGSASIRIPPSWYSLALDPVANCTVTSPLYPETGLVLGSTADVTFTVVCK